MKGRCTAAAAGLLLLLAGCGGSASLTAGAAVVLQNDAATLSAAARAGSAAGVTAALGALRRDVTAQQRAGHLDDARAAAVLDAAARVAADRVVAAPAVQTKPSPTSSTVGGTRTTAPARRKGKGKAEHDD